MSALRVHRKRSRRPTGGGAAVHDDDEHVPRGAVVVGPAAFDRHHDDRTPTVPPPDETDGPLPHGYFAGGGKSGSLSVSSACCSGIYRNSLHPGETLERGHVSLPRLVPPGTAHCLCTTYVCATGSWLWHVFGGNDDGGVGELLVMRHDGRSVGEGGRKVGDGELTPVEVATARGNNGGDDESSEEEEEEEDGDEDDEDGKGSTKVRRIPNWNYLRCRPSSGGFLHAKLLLFRSPSGLRVVVAGSNLCPQWVADRDILWVRDFDLLPSPARRGANGVSRASKNPRSPRSSGGGGDFGLSLRSFLTDLTGCREARDQLRVRSFVSSVLDGVDFSTAGANVEFVHSFPRPVGSRDDVGGWRMLARAVERLRGPMPEPDTDDEDDGGDFDSDCGRGSSARDCGGTSERGTTEPRADEVLYASSGSFGDLTPAFLLQMRSAAVEGRTPPPTTLRRPSDDVATSWDDVPSSIRCLWPGLQTARTMLPSGLVGSLRAISLRHWFSIPEGARRRVFGDAPSNTPESGWGVPSMECHPVSHGKFLLTATAAGAGRRSNGRQKEASAAEEAATTPPATIYVGSHNFSRNAWGLGGTAPRNIEAGVVLSTSDPAAVREWVRRLPCSLPPAPTVGRRSSLSEEGEGDNEEEAYAPASAHPGIREKWERGETKEALRLLNEWLRRDSKASGSKASLPDNGFQDAVQSKRSRKTQATDVIDLCDSD